MNEAYDLFISYSSQDKTSVHRLAEDLTLSGLKVWLDEWEIFVGDTILQKIQKGLETCEFLAIWLTTSSVSSPWVETEWQTVYYDEINSGKTRVLPLLAEDCDIPQFLKGKKYADFRSDYSDGLREFLLSIQPKYKRQISLWPSLRKYYRKPTPEAMNSEEIKDVFKFNLDEFPYPFVDEESRSVDVLFISGPTRYELEMLESRFSENLDNDGNIVGFSDKIWGGYPIVLGDSAYNLALVSEIIGEFFYIAGNKGYNIVREKGRNHLPYMEIDEAVLEKHNIVCIPCGDVNPILPTILQEFEMRFKTLCPVHHDPYHKSETIVSEVSNRVYEKVREHERAGYILLIPNPWNHQKAAIVCGGNHGVGTQSALLRILFALRGDMPLYNTNLYPYKIVAPKKRDKITNMVVEVRELE